MPDPSSIVSPVLPLAPQSILDATTWRARSSTHREQVEQLTAAHRRRRSRQERHPVWDFMFDYYPISPGKLAQWHPGAGVGLVPGGQADKAASELPTHQDNYGWWDVEKTVASGRKIWMVDTQKLWERRGFAIEFIHRLLRRTSGRKAQLGCFGLHEWAMVYRDTPRHPEPLRLGRAETDALVEGSRLVCTHYDAFRFFTPDAAPRNAQHLTRDQQIEWEQPGCLHANMDLYKWATKLGPLVPGELWLDTFRLACDVRRLDMEASPYDLSQWGFAPVRIETPAGRAEYVRRQRELSQRAAELRHELLGCIELAYPQLRDPE